MSVVGIARGLLLAAGLTTAAAAGAQAAGKVEWPSLEWSFTGVFGTYDQGSL